MEFEKFEKIGRYSRKVIVTEKIDGTNSCIFIGENGEFLVGSRKRWITPEQDNFGFAKWAYENKDELMKLGPGRHFGEWWGSGVLRGYGLSKGEKRFSLFNVTRWCLFGDEPKMISINEAGEERKQQTLPKCVGLVPILWEGLFDDLNVKQVMDDLLKNGSSVSPGFMRPEGIIIFHAFNSALFKKTFEKDEGKFKTGT